MIITTCMNQDDLGSICKDMMPLNIVSKSEFEGLVKDNEQAL